MDNKRITNASKFYFLSRHYEMDQLSKSVASTQLQNARLMASGAMGDSNCKVAIPYYICGDPTATTV